MRNRVLLLPMIGIGLIAFQAPALADLSCSKADAAVASLNRQYGEKPLVEGRTETGQRLVFLWNADTGSWTVLLAPLSKEDDLCIVLGGDKGGPAARVGTPS